MDKVDKKYPQNGSKLKANSVLKIFNNQTDDYLYPTKKFIDILFLR